MSKKKLSKKDTQADFTRGGQITFHNLRMLAQVSTKVGKVGFWIFLIILSLGLYLMVNKQLFFSVFEYIKAYGYVLFNKPKHLVPSLYNGKWDVEYAGTMVNDNWYIQNNHKFLIILGSTAIVALIISILTTYLITKWLKNKGKEQSSDKFIRGMELANPQELTIALKKNNALSEIKIDNYKVMVKDFGVYQTLIDGTIGTGKTVLLMKFLKYIRSKGDRVIVYDKGCTLTPFFYREEKDNILNPFDKRSKLWNVWADADEITDFQNIADALIPLHGQSDPFWVEAARSIFVSTANKMKTDKNKTTYKLLSMLLTSTLEDIASYLDGTDAATLVSTKAQKTAISIKSILATYVKSLRFLAELEESNKDEVFSIRNWIQNEEENTDSWLFLTSNTRQHASMRPLISVWITIASLALLEMPPSSDRRIWFVVDEMPSLHAIPNLPETLAEVRKFGGCWVVGIQSYAQLRKTYGADYSETIFDLLNSRFFFRSPSAPMAEISSKELGEQEVDVMKTQYSIGANTIRDGVSLGSQTITRRVVSSAEIMQLSNLECYLRIAGNYPITKLKLAIDQTLQSKTTGFMPLKQAKTKSKKMKAIELMIGDSMFGYLKQLGKDELEKLDGSLKFAIDDDGIDISTEIEAHHKNMQAFKEDDKPAHIKLREQFQQKHSSSGDSESNEDDSDEVKLEQSKEDIKQEEDATQIKAIEIKQDQKAVDNDNNSKSNQSELKTNTEENEIGTGV